MKKQFVVLGGDVFSAHKAATSVADLKASKHHYHKEYLRTGNGTYRNMANTLGAIINEIEGTHPQKVATIAIDQLVGGIQNSLKRTARPKFMEQAMEIEILDAHLTKDLGFRVLPQRVEVPAHLDEDVRIAIADAVRDKLSKGTTKLSSRRIANSLLSERKDLLNDKEAIVILVDDILH